MVTGAVAEWIKAVALEAMKLSQGEVRGLIPASQSKVVFQGRLEQGHLRTFSKFNDIIYSVDIAKFSFEILYVLKYCMKTTHR